MSKATHTPGPWVVDGPDHFNDYTIHPAGRQLAIAAIVNGAINDVSGHGDEHKANARLIAAAPNLLEALEQLLTVAEMTTFSDQYPGECERARAAIAKARGQS